MDVRSRRARLSADDREDLTQQVLEQYWRAWKGGSDEPENVDAWIETATRNALHNRIRDQANNPALQFGQGADEPVALLVEALRASSTSASAEQADLARQVRIGLTSEESELFDLVLQELPDKEIAQELGIFVANAKKRRQRLLVKLRVQVEANPGLLEELRAPHPQRYAQQQWRQGRPH